MTIEKYRYLPLFVYGTLLSDQPAFDLIAPAVERSAPATVQGLALYSVGRYPVAAPGVGRIVGEVHWLCATGYAALLDELELYEGPEYTRRAYPVQTPAAEQLAEAWIFVGDPVSAARLPPIPHGDWRQWLRRQA